MFKSSPWTVSSLEIHSPQKSHDPWQCGPSYQIKSAWVMPNKMFEVWYLHHWNFHLKKKVVLWCPLYLHHMERPFKTMWVFPTSRKEFVLLSMSVFVKANVVWFFLWKQNTSNSWRFFSALPGWCCGDFWRLQKTRSCHEAFQQCDIGLVYLGIWWFTCLCS